MLFKGTAVVVSLSFIAAVIFTTAQASQSGQCGGARAVHRSYGEHITVCALLDGIEDSLSVYQGGGGTTWFEYDCNCTNEDCYEDSAPLPASHGHNEWNTPAAGCTWGDTHACTCTQPKSPCCGDLLP